MSVDRKLVNRVFTFNNKKYIAPNKKTTNRDNFDVLQRIMLNYTYNEFVKRFDHIYNHSDDYSKVMCCYMREICRQYDKLKEDNPTWWFSKIICEIKENAGYKYRFNNANFHFNYINFVLYWKYYKISYDNCDTVSLFNSLLDKLKLPDDLRSGFPELVSIFDKGLKAVIETVNKAHKLYYEEKNKKALEELDKKFKVEFKEKLNEYESYFNRIEKKSRWRLDDVIYEILFDYYGSNFKIYITNNLLKSLIENGNYNKLKDKYEYIELDFKTEYLSKYVYKNFRDYFENIDNKERLIQNIYEIENKVNDICPKYCYNPKYNFKSKEHEELIMNLLQ